MAKKKTDSEQMDLIDDLYAKHKQILNIDYDKHIAAYKHCLKTLRQRL